MVQVRRRRGSILAALISSATLAGILIGVAQAPASATVTAVRGSACGFTTKVGLFAGPQAVRGCGTAVPPTDPSYSPSVALPPGGSATAITATDPDGAKGVYGPATIFGGIWPPDVLSPTPSGPLTASTQGTPGGGAVTSFADITLNPAPKPVVCYADRNLPNPKPTNCNDPGGFGPSPVWGDSLHVECRASESAVTGSATFSNAYVAKATIVGGENDGSPDPAATDAVPNPTPVNWTRSGVLSNVGDTFTVVFNEQIVNPDGSLTVNAVHLYLFGQFAVGEAIKGQATCGTTPSPLSTADTVAPTCGTPVVAPSNPLSPGSPPKEPRTETIGVFDARGLQSIKNIQTNGVVQLGNPMYDYVDDTVPDYLRFIPGQTGPLPIVARQTDPSRILSWSFDAVDTAGNTTHCSGVGDSPPVAGDDTYSTSLANPSLTVAAPGVLANDTDVDVANHVYGNTLSARLTGNPANDPNLNYPGTPIPDLVITTANGGTVVLHPDGSFTYTPATGFGGADNFTYTVRDGAGGSDTATVTINVSTLPTLYVSDISLPEGNSATTPATFTITRTGDTSTASTVSVSTSDRTATAGSDYTAVGPTTVNFAAGDTSETVDVPVIGDRSNEANETFALVLSAATGATIADGTATATILTDDSPAFLSVNDVTVTEGNVGTKQAVFVVTRSGNTSVASSVSVTTTGGTATAGSDYTAVAPTTVNLAPGVTSQTVDVEVIGDTTVESNESFFLALSAPVGATIADLSGTATIVNDDSAVVPGPATFLSIGDTSVVEGSSGVTNATFTVTRTGDTSAASTVMYRSNSGGTATAGTDYTAVTSLATLTFPAGSHAPKTVTERGRPGCAGFLPCGTDRKPRRPRASWKL